MNGTDVVKTWLTGILMFGCAPLAIVLMIAFGGGLLGIWGLLSLTQVEGVALLFLAFGITCGGLVVLAEL